MKLSRVFISVLGTSDYKECTYKNEHESITTRFIQEAIIHMYMKDITGDDKIIILLTKRAKETNWNGRTVSTSITDIISKSLKINNMDEGKVNKIKDILLMSSEFTDEKVEKSYVGLRDILHEKFNTADIIPIDIDEGKSETELWNVFQSIYDAVNENDEVIFDVTHGFRSIPMLALTVLNYAKSLKHINIAGIYYGAYEAKDENNVAPIFDLTVYNNILEWTNAVNTFIEYGNGAAVKDLYENLCAQRMKQGDYSLKMSTLNTFVHDVFSFTRCIDTSRGKIINSNECKSKKIKKSIYYSAKAIEDSLSKVKEEKADMVKPIIPLFNMINKNIKNFTSNNNVNIGVETIRWCIKYNLIQQGYTAFEETIKTYLCSKYDLSDISKQDRENIVKRSLNILKKNKSDKFEDIRTIPTKYILDKDKPYIDKIELLVKTIPEDIIDLSYISDFRNDINHFGYSKNVLDYRKLSDQLKLYFKQFEEIRTKYIDVDFRNIQN